MRLLLNECRTRKVAFMLARGRALSSEELCPKYTLQCGDQGSESGLVIFNRVRARVHHENEPHSQQIR